MQISYEGRGNVRITLDGTLRVRFLRLMARLLGLKTMVLHQSGDRKGRAQNIERVT